MSLPNKDDVKVEESGKSTFRLMDEDDDETIDLDEKKESKKDDNKDDKEEDKKTKEDSENDDEVLEEEDELKEIEDDLLEEDEEVDEEKLELTIPVKRKEILKAYPDLFKKFPYLERAYYREQQYTEILPTIDDAKEAVEKSKTLDNFERDLLAGNTEKILGIVKTQDPKAFNKIVDDYMPTLAKVDEKAYHHVLGNVIKTVIISMVTEGKKSSNEALSNAAQIINQYVFGTSDFKPPTTLSTDDKTDTSKEDELKQREAAFIKKQFENTRDDLDTRVSNVLKSTIEMNIDPKKSMTDYVRRNASRDASETLQDLIGKDSRFKVILDKLWEKAFENSFDKSSIDRIRSAYLSKAKTLLPSVIKKARQDALKGLGRRSSTKEDDDVEIDTEDDSKESKTTERERPRKSTSSSTSGKIKSGKDIPHNVKTFDYLMED